MRRIAPVLVSGALLVAACASGDDSASDTGSEPASTSTETASTTETSDATASSPTAAASATTAATGAQSSPAASAGCGADAGELGRTSHAVQIDGLERSYLQYLPAAYEGETPVPLVIDMHGLTSNAQAQAAVTGFEALSESEGFAVVSPNGTGLVPYWNIVSGGRADGDGTIESLLSRVVDDVSFTEQLVAHLDGELCVDTNRIYATGLSNGALMASAVGCDLADVFAAVASVAGTLAPAGCEPAAPMLSIHGTGDNVVLYDGGLGEPVRALISNEQFTEGTPLADQLAIIEVIDGILPPLDTALSEWAAVNGCEPTPETEMVGDDVEHRTWNGCTADVEQYVVVGGGHTWPGSAAMRGAAESDSETASALGTMTENLDSTSTIWEFFESHSLADGGGQ